MQYYKRGENIDPEKHNVGKSPNFIALNNARKNLLHHTTYNRNRELLNYSGCPEKRSYPAPVENISGDFDCSYFIVFPVRGTADDKIRIGYKMTTWNNYDATANCNFQFDGVGSDKLASTAVVTGSKQTTSQRSSGYDKPIGLTVQDDIELDYDSRDFGGYGYVKVSFEHLIPASFVSWIQPQNEADYNAIDTKYGSQAFGMSNSAFNIGQSLRGSSAYNDSNGSVGALCQRQYDDDNGGSNMVSNSELCLFQWGHPAGLHIYGGGASLNDQPILPYDIKIKGRELIEDDIGFLDVAILYRADVDTQIKLYVASTATTYTYNLTERTGSSPLKAVPFSKVPFSGDGDDLTITCTVSDTKAVELKTIAIFENNY